MEVSLSSERERCRSAKNVRAKKTDGGGGETNGSTTTTMSLMWLWAALWATYVHVHCGQKDGGSPGQLVAGLKKKRGMGKAAAHRSRAERQVHDVKKQEHAGGRPVSRAIM